MATNFVQPGNHLAMTASGTVTSGEPIQFGNNLFGVALTDAESGEQFTLAVDGVWTLPKESTDVFDIGTAVYWNIADGLVTTDSNAGGNILVGVAIEAAGNPSATVKVRLNGAGGSGDVPTEFADLTAAINADGDGDAVVANHLIVPSDAPAAANSTGKAGTIVWESGFLYVCVATNTWQRVAIATWP